MKSKFRLIHIVTAAVNTAAVAGALILSAVGSSAAKAQKYNYAADRWTNGSKDDYSQLSCFFGKDAGFEKNSAENLTNQVLAELKTVSVTPEEGRTLVPYAYSAPAGSASVTCDGISRAEADITAVGGDFFFFRDFSLLSGSFFDDRDLMQDGAVIDRQLAWQLYGSDDVAGMNIYINDVRLYISGVIDTPATKPEKRCIGDTPKAYISYYAADMIFGGGGSGQDMEIPQMSFDSVTCYEAIIPDPVDKFAYNSVKNAVADSYRGMVSIVNNSERFQPKQRLKALKKLDDYAVRNDTVIFPFWENASRIVDIRLSLIYGGRRLLLIIPLVTLAWLLIKALMLYRRKKEGLKKAAGHFISSKWNEIKEKSRKKQAQTTERIPESEPEKTKES